MAERGIILDYEAFANVNYPNIVDTFPNCIHAELGDKTQLATVLFASKEPSNLLLLSNIAGVGFIAIGVWTVWQA